LRIPSTGFSICRGIPRHLHETIHACLGCALTEGGEVVGALTADARDPHAFDDLDMKLIAMLGALAGAAVRTTTLIEALRQRAGSQRACGA
jgi:transcriptional regulator with GAF, ATPase, and Fis domain